MKLNQLKMGVILSYMQTVLNAIISLAYTPIMLRLLGQSEYGVYTLASSMISYLGLLNFGLSSSYVKYFSRYKNKKNEQGLAQLNTVFLVVYCCIAIVAFTAGIVISNNVHILFGQKYTAYELAITKKLMLILSFNLMLTFISTPFASYVSANEQFVFQKILSMGKTILSPLVTIPVLLLGFHSVGMAVVTTVISLAVDLSNVLFCLKKLKMRFLLKGADFRLMGEIASFSVFIALNSLVDQINWQVDKLILSRYHGTRETAVYSVGSQINTLYIAVSTSISAVFIPRVHRIVYAEDRDEQFTRLFTRIGRIQMLVLGLVGSGLVLFGVPFIRLWAGKEYAGAYAIMLLLVLPETVPLIQNLGIEIQRARNMHQFRTKIYVVMALINIAISIPLGKKFGGFGCAVGTCFALLVANGAIMNWYYANRMGLDMKYFWKQILKMLSPILICGVVGALGRNLFEINNFCQLVIGVAGYAVLYCIFIWKTTMNKEEKSLITSFLNKITKKKRKGI